MRNPESLLERKPQCICQQLIIAASSHLYSVARGLLDFGRKEPGGEGRRAGRSAAPDDSTSADLGLDPHGSLLEELRRRLMGGSFIEQLLHDLVEHPGRG